MLSMQDKKRYRMENKRVLPGRYGDKQWTVAQTPNAEQDGRGIDFKRIQQIYNEKRVDIVTPIASLSIRLSVMITDEGNIVHVSHKIVPPTPPVSDDAPR